MSEARERELVERLRENARDMEAHGFAIYARPLNEAADLVESLSASTQVDAMREALDIEGIQKLAADVNFYSGNEASGRAEVLRRKAAAWDRVVAALSAQAKTTSPSALDASRDEQ